jgi:hypothetical protein
LRSCWLLVSENPRRSCQGGKWVTFGSVQSSLHLCKFGTARLL